MFETCLKPCLKHMYAAIKYPYFFVPLPSHGNGPMKIPV